MASRHMASSLLRQATYARPHVPTIRTFATTMCMRNQAPNPEVSQFADRIQGLVKEYEKFNDRGGSADSEYGKNLVYYNDKRHHLSAEMARLRVLPKDRSFYMANPPHEEIVRELNDLLQLHITIPTIPKEQTDKKTTWISQDEYKTMLGGEHFKPKYYKALLRLLNRLTLIDPQLMPSEVRDAIAPFTKRVSDNWTERKYPTLDEFGRAIAVGRRKTASARIQMVKCNDPSQGGQILVNGKHLDAYFKRHSDRVSIMYPLQVCGVVDKYNIFATVVGGGSTGQTDAVAHGIARAIVIHNPLFLTRLSRAGVLQRDPRKKERKKPGKPKARKSYTWVKR